MIEMDGSLGEGGGQILRTSLALSAITGQPFRMRKIRQNRNPPGLKKQHLMAVMAAQQACQGEVSGASVGSTEITFLPGPLQGGEFHWDIGTAGSTMLVVQTVLPILWHAPENARVTLTGGTHNPWAPTYEFLLHTFLPTVQRMGFQAELALARHGFYPKGGGKVQLQVTPRATAQTPSAGSHARPLDLTSRTEPEVKAAVCLLAKLERHIAARELQVFGDAFDLPLERRETLLVKDSLSPGNVLWAEVQTGPVKELMCQLGERSLPAEEVSARLVEEVSQFLAFRVPVGPHLADQLLLPMALAGGGQFVTMPLTMHTQTNQDTIRAFLPVRFTNATQEDGAVLVTVQVEGTHST